MGTTLATPASSKGSSDRFCISSPYRAFADYSARMFDMERGNQSRPRAVSPVYTFGVGGSKSRGTTK
jgi:hypothetical protein